MWNLRQQWQCALYRTYWDNLVWAHHEICDILTLLWICHQRGVLRNQLLEKITGEEVYQNKYLPEQELLIWLRIGYSTVHFASTMTWARVLFLLLFRFSPLWRALGFDFMFVLGFSSVADICSCCSIFENNLPPWWICVDLSDFLHRCYLNQYHMFKFLLLCLHSFYGFRILGFIDIKNKLLEMSDEILRILLDEKYLFF